MSFFNINKDRCDKDGICVIECPTHIIEMSDEGPVLIAGGEEKCLRCGHCVAVCPKAAFGLEFLSPDQCMPIQKDLTLSSEQIEHFLRSRRSVRRYKDKPVPKDLFEKALAIASCAPTGSNRQSVKWLIVDQKQDVEKMASLVVEWWRYLQQSHPETAEMMNVKSLVQQWEKGVDRICRNAPQLVFAYATEEYGSREADCHTALSYLELALPGFGLGSCWAGYITYAVNQWPDLAKMLDLPDGHKCHGALMVGVPKYKYYRAPERNLPDIQYHAG